MRKESVLEQIRSVRSILSMLEMDVKEFDVRQEVIVETYQQLKEIKGDIYEVKQKVWTN